MQYSNPLLAQYKKHWIKENPDIFSAYYRFKSKHIFMNSIFEIKITFMCLLLIIGNSIFVQLYKRKKKQPLDFFYSFKKWRDKKGYQKIYSTDGEHLTKQRMEFLFTEG